MSADDFSITHVAITERGIELGGWTHDTRGRVYVDRGNGSIWIGSFEELWKMMWAAVAAAIYMKANGGRCRCGCTVTDCAYCIGECFDGY